jgi:hypothetical protein
LACMQNVGALRRLGDCSIRCHLELWSLGLPWYWDMWNMGKGRKQLELFSQNATRCVVRLYGFCGGANCMRQWDCTWRGQVRSSVNCWKWFGNGCLFGE